MKTLNNETMTKHKQILTNIDLDLLKRLINDRNKSSSALNECSQSVYPTALKNYYRANLDVIEYTNDWVNEQDEGLILFEIDNRIYSIKKRRNTNYKYIGYTTKESEG